MSTNLNSTIASYMDRMTSDLEAREVRSLCKDWKFCPHDVPHAFREDFDDSSWRTLNIPHDYSVEGQFSEEHEANGFVQSGVLWYRKHLILPTGHRQEKYYILFDGVAMKSQVWLNGQFLGQHPYGFTPFWCDITPFIHHEEGAVNIIAVRADSSLQPYSRFYTGAGLYRQVFLISMNALHIEQWGIRTDIAAADEDRAELTIRTNVRVERYKDTIWNAFNWQGTGIKDNHEVQKNAVLITSIIDSKGRIVAEAQESKVFPEFSRHEFTQELRVDKPSLWSPTHPEMYRIRSRLLANGELVDDCMTPLGIRTLSFHQNEGFSINGKTMKLKGVCLHQDAGIYGGAVPYKTWVRRLGLLKKAGVNAIRTAHHPFPSEFYHVCDFLGLLVMDEAFDEWQSGWTRGYSDQPYGKNRYGYYLDFQQWHDTDLRAMIRRGRNHPSVIMWSVGNEIPELYFKDGIDILKRLVKICKEEDNTRPVTVCAEGIHMLPIYEGIMDQVDVAGYNYVSNREGKSYYANIHRQRPSQVVVGSETSFDPEHWQAIQKQNYAIGQFLWVGYDYIGEGIDRFGEDACLGDTFDISRLASSNKSADRILRHGYAYGMVDSIDTPNGEYFYRASIWSDTSVLQLAVKAENEEDYGHYRYLKADLHWNFPDKGANKTVYCFTNCEQVELVLNGISLGLRRTEPDNPFAMEWNLEYAPGILQAIGYIKGKPVCTSELVTSRRASRIQLNCQDNAIQGARMEDTAIEIAVVDESGVVVPDASNRVTVKVKGSGSLLGVISADLTSNTSYRSDSCHAYKGRCLAVIRSSDEPGPIQVVVEGEGVATARLMLTNC
ncbi:glycoside hydrolase family 2 TIM barrel-domain containing protein [Paenibacillus sp. IITD108]|uniref:glycoside hydrolase family 2 TIM barrel-domain containing protein n=1 Tax=Paenibacillus sp. IITD108 TaxID=3116649 RepID=UPI002F3EE599